jgi:hypothetical protein
MKLKELIKWAAVAGSIAMPFTVTSMASAFVESGIAHAALRNREDEVRRLTELDGDIRSLAPAQASTILSRHSLSSAGDLTNRLVMARSDLTTARAEFVSSTVRPRRTMVVGFLCVAIASWAAVSLAIVWPRSRGTGPVTV